MGDKDVALNAQNADLKSKIAKQPKALPVAKAMLKSKLNRKSGHSEHLQTLLQKGTEEEAVELGEPRKTTFEDLEANNAVRDASEQGCRGPGVHGVCLFMLLYCCSCYTLHRALLCFTSRQRMWTSRQTMQTLRRRMQNLWQRMQTLRQRMQSCRQDCGHQTPRDATSTSPVMFLTFKHHTKYCLVVFTDFSQEGTTPRLLQH